MIDSEPSKIGALWFYIQTLKACCAKAERGMIRNTLSARHVSPLMFNGLETPIAKRKL